MSGSTPSGSRNDRADGRADEAPYFEAPPGSSSLGLRILLISLGVFFAAGLAAYVTARTGRLGHQVTSGSGIEHVNLPVWFWVSTLVILVSSACLHYAQVSARVGHARRARRAFLATTALGYLFLLLQIPGLVQLVGRHRAAAETQTLIYMSVLFLVVLHALHVIGGLIPATGIAASSSREPLGASRAALLRRMAIYWHFLAVVWMVLFSTFLLVR
jgi:heme/copper-type cytochrome/quinol oxidase subunit 3